MKLHFLGANRQVTGSRYCLEVGDARVMVDCGLFQEREFLDRNWHPCPLPANSFDAMILTHAHIDHTGLVPRLVNQGFHNPIFATAPTCALADIMLLDSARIQWEDAEYKKKRHRREKRKTEHEPAPLYLEDDVRDTLKLLKPCQYDKPVQVADGVEAVFHEAGHILGSAFVEVRVTEQGRTRIVIFSGDIGQWGKPIIRDPELAPRQDFLIMESTYGDRDHEDHGDVASQLSDIANRTLRRGGKLVIPTFAVERAQELMYHISTLVHNDVIPDAPVYLDSPMAVDVTDVFNRFHDYFDEEAWERIASKEPPLRFPGLRLVTKSSDSRKINDYKGPCIIMSTSGMCNAGRIKHHLRQTIDDKRNTILFVGYQAHGTLGRRLVERESNVRIHGRNYTVRAEIAQIYGFSGHADRRQLLKWARGFQSPPSRVFLTHGEEKSAFALAETLRETFHWNTDVPEYGAVVEL